MKKRIIEAIIGYICNGDRVQTVRSRVLRGIFTGDMLIKITTKGA